MDKQSKNAQRKVLRKNALNILLEKNKDATPEERDYWLKESLGRAWLANRLIKVLNE